MTHPSRASNDAEGSQSGFQKYHVLHMLGRLLTWLGALMLMADVGGTIVLLYQDLPSTVTSDMMLPVTANLLTIGMGLLGALLSLMVMAAGQAIGCFLDIEAHLRLVAEGVKNATQ